jgi:hypothetical protein
MITASTAKGATMLISPLVSDLRRPAADAPEAVISKRLALSATNPLRP